MKQKEKDIVQTEVMKKVMRPLRVVWYLIIAFLLFFILMFFLLKVPAVQNYIADTATSIISKRLNTKVSIDRVDINLFRGVELEEFYMEDLAGDTLIYAGSFYSDFYNSVRGFYSKDFNIESADLRNGTIRLKRTARDPLFNIQRVFNQDYDPYLVDTSVVAMIDQNIQVANKPKQFDLYLKNLSLTNIHFVNIDSLGGNLMDGQIDELKAGIDTFDIRALKFHLSNLDIQQTSLEILKITSDSLARPLPIGQEKNVDFQVGIDDFTLDDSNFAFKDTRFGEVIADPKSFNPQDFFVSKINLKAKDVVIIDPYYLTSSVESLTLETDGIKIKAFEAERFFIEKRKAGMENFILKSDKSTIQENFTFKYRQFPDWRDFVNKVLLDGDLKNSTVALSDIVYFAPKLQTNTFFQENMSQKMLITGKVMGAVNRLNLQKLNLKLGSNLSLQGSVIARDLTDPDETLLNVTVDRLLTDILTLQKLIPGFTIPTNFNKLNKLDFNGRFDGYYQDFVAYGDIHSDLGRADVDMRLNLKDGSKNASYSGKMNLLDFDLSSWTGSSDFGKLSFSANVENGRGLDLNSAYAELGGEIIAFDFRGYRYNGLIDGKLEQNLFDGKLKMKDEFMDFDFNGNINFQEAIPLYDFDADVRQLNLAALNLATDISDVRGVLDIKLKGTTIDNIVGSALGNQIAIVRNQDTLDFGHLALASTLDEKNLRSIFIDSDIGNAEIVGEYNLTELPDAAIAMVKNNYPSFTKKLKLIQGEPQGQVLADFKLQLNDASDLVSFFLKKESELENLKLDGKINYLENDLMINLDLPYASYDQIKVNKLKAIFDVEDELGIFDIEADTTIINNLVIEELTGSGKLSRDSVRFAFQTTQLLDSVRNVDISGILAPSDDRIFLSLERTKFNILGEDWNLSKGNEIIVGDEYLSLTNVTLSDRFRSIKLRSTNQNKGVETDIEDLQLSLVNRWINKDNFILNGKITAKVAIKNIFDLNGIFVESEITDVYVNEQSMGKMTINANTDLKSKLVTYDILLDHFLDKVTVEGSYEIASKMIDAEVIADGFPLNFLENFLGDGISETKGRVFADMKVDGLLDDLNTVGKGEIRDGFTRVNYLGTRYSFEDAQFKISKNYIDFTGANLRDSREQTARVTGGITHNSFRNLGCNVNIRSENFTLLNTNPQINPTYHGLGIGKASVDIQGEFTNIRLFIEATTGKGTEMTMPVTYTNTTRDQSFIPIITREKFISDLESQEDGQQHSNYVGITLEMQLHVTPAAQMTILFDPVSGHKLKGTGRGDIQLFLDPTGEIKMQGSYNVDQGQYDFALQNFIKKEFVIRSDGKITWSGDPLNAEIDIEADYKRLRVPLSVFLAEFIADNEDLQTIANQEEEVQLTVRLTDKLLNPTINFDIQFPNLNGQLRSFAENKLATLKSDPLGLNNQVFGLLIFNNFIPYDNPIANTNIGSSFNVIVSELLSAQLSAYVSSIFESVLNENGLIYNVDVDVRLENAGLTSANNTNYGLTVTPKFNTDKFEIVFAGDYLGGNGTLNPYASGDFIVDYFLQEDRKIKLRIYGRSDKDIINGRFTKLGTGLYARKEFSNFRDLRKSFTRAARELKEQDQQNNEQ